MRGFFSERSFPMLVALIAYRYHNYYPALHEDSVKNFAIFSFMIILKIFSSYILYKKFWLSNRCIVSKIFAIENVFATDPNVNEYDCNIVIKITTIKKLIFE